MELVEEFVEKTLIGVFPTLQAFVTSRYKTAVYQLVADPGDKLVNGVLIHEGSVEDYLTKQPSKRNEDVARAPEPNRGVTSRGDEELSCPFACCSLFRPLQAIHRLKKILIGRLTDIMSVKPSPYEPGLFLVREPSGTETQWDVGERYNVMKPLGEGSFSCVCLATDKTTGEQ
eukprot:gene21363-28302_t